jgi:hypothetical protein
MIKSGQTTRLQVEKATNTILDRVEALLRSSKPKDQLAHLTLLAALNPPAPTAVWKTAQDVILGIVLNTQQNDSSVQKSGATKRRYWSRLKHANLLHFRDPKYNDTRSGTASVSAAGAPGTDPLDLDGVARCLASFTRIGNDPLLPITFRRRLYTQRDFAAFLVNSMRTQFPNSFDFLHVPHWRVSMA